MKQQGKQKKHYILQIAILYMVVCGHYGCPPTESRQSGTESQSGAHANSPAS
jgi:hypothetical protein